MQQELLVLANQCTVDQLLVEFGTQGQRRQRLRLPACKDGAAVCAGQVIDFRPDGANVG